MLYWAFACLLIAVIAGLLGFTTLAGAAALAAKMLFGIFLVVCVLMFGMVLVAGRKLL